MDEKTRKEVQLREDEDDAWAEELRQQILAEEKAKKIESKQEFTEKQPNLNDEVEFNLSGE